MYVLLDKALWVIDVPARQANNLHLGDLSLVSHQVGQPVFVVHFGKSDQEWCGRLGRLGADGTETPIIDLAPAFGLGSVFGSQATAVRTLDGKLYVAVVGGLYRTLAAVPAVGP